MRPTYVPYPCLMLSSHLAYAALEANSVGGDQDEETTVTFVSRLKSLLVRWRLRARVSGAWSVVLAWLGRSGVTGRDEPTPEASLGDCMFGIVPKLCLGFFRELLKEFKLSQTAGSDCRLT